ncbi:beta strand repeat-containing protein, partial [Sphingobacterium pedocola]|nr:hypothetical protein [Sphingobacterium pedocola]
MKFSSSLLWVCGLIFLSTSALLGQTTVDFNGLINSHGYGKTFGAADGYDGPSPINEEDEAGGFVFIINSTNNSVITAKSEVGYQGSTTLYDNNSAIGGITQWTIKKKDNSNFQFKGIYLKDAGAGGSLSGTVSAYRAGVPVGSSVSVNFDGSLNQTFELNADFDDIDEIRIGGTDLNLYVDQFMAGPPKNTGTAEPAAVSSIVVDGTPNSSASSMSFLVTFTKPVVNVSLDDFNLEPTGNASGNIASVTPISTAVYRVTITEITGEGTLRLDLNSATDIATAIGNIGGTPAFTAGDSHYVGACGLVTFDHGQTDNATSFSANGMNYQMTGNWKVKKNLPATGMGGSPFNLTGTGTGSFVIKSTSNSFRLNSFYAYLSSDINGANPTDTGTVTVVGKLGGISIHILTVSTGFNTNFATDNGYTKFDLGTSAIDELVITLSGGFQYLDLDDISLCPVLNTPPVIGNLNGNAVSWAGVGNIVNLDASADATVADAEFDATNWKGATLTVQRANSPLASDIFGFNQVGYGYTVSGGNLQTAGTTFATFTNTGGVLTITFNMSATNALVRNVLRTIGYRNDTPAGDAIIRFTLSDGTLNTTANVAVRSNTIYITNSTDAAAINLNDGVSFSEAVAIAANMTTGNQSLVFTNDVNGEMTLAGNLSINEDLVINADLASGLVIKGSTITLGAIVSFTNASGNITIASALAGSGVLSKYGAGTLIIQNSIPVSSVSGLVIVLAGTLQLDAVLPCHLAIESGATLTGNGGTVGGTLTVNSGGTLSPGGSSIGSLKINGGLNMATDAMLNVQINGVTAGTGYDQVIVEGTVNLTEEPTLDVMQGYDPDQGDVYLIIVNNSSGAIANAFHLLSEGGSIVAAGNGKVLKASYMGGTGNDFTLTAPINSAPVVTTTSGATAFIEGSDVVSTPVVIDAGITVDDMDNTTLASATVSISANFQIAEDILAFVNDGISMGNIVGNYNSGTGMLSLTSSGASATLAEWQSALASVTYNNSSDDPNIATRQLSFVVHDGMDASTASTKDVSITAVNDTPIISGTPMTSVNQDVAYSFVPTVTDEDSDVFLFSIVNQPSWTSFDSVTGELSGIPTNANVGTTTGIVISVSDGTLSASLPAFDLTVTTTLFTGLSLSDKVFVYDGTEKMLEFEGILPNDASVIYSGNGRTSVGSQTVSAVFSAPGYTPLVLTADLEITPATITGVTFENNSFVYDGTVKSLAISGTLPDGTSVAYTNNSRTDVGTQEVTATITGSNYTELVLTADLTITPATITGITFGDGSFVYDGTAKSLAISGTLPAGASVAYSNNSRTDVGTQGVTATITASNYTELVLTADLTITPATITGVTFDDGSFVYDGTVKSLATSGTLPAGTAVAYTNNTRTDVGAQEVTATITGSNFITLVLTADLTITQATITGITFGDGSFVYDGTVKLLAITGTLPVGTAAAYTNNSRTDVGTHVVTVTISGSNYMELVLTADLEVTPSTITGITFGDGSFVYDGTAKSLAISGTLPVGTAVAYTNNSRKDVGIQLVTATITGSNYTELAL